MDDEAQPISPDMEFKADPDSDSEPIVTSTKSLKRRVRVKKEDPGVEANAGLNLMFDDFDKGNSESDLSDYDSDISDVFGIDDTRTHELSKGGIENLNGIDWFICGRE
jgi:hypothetical protein